MIILFKNYIDCFECYARNITNEFSKFITAEFAPMVALYTVTVLITLAYILS